MIVKSLRFFAFLALFSGVGAFAQDAGTGGHLGIQQKEGWSDVTVWNPEGGGGGDSSTTTSNDLLLANCLTKALTTYTTCRANANSLIPYVTAYNLWKCEAEKTKDILDCHTKYDG